MMYGMHEPKSIQCFREAGAPQKGQLMNRFKPNGSVWRVPLCVTLFVNHSPPYHHRHCLCQCPSHSVIMASSQFFHKIFNLEYLTR